MRGGLRAGSWQTLLGMLTWHLFFLEIQVFLNALVPLSLFLTNLAYMIEGNNQMDVTKFYTFFWFLGALAPH